MFDRIEIAKGSCWNVNTPLVGKDRVLTLRVEGELDDSLSLGKAWNYLSKIESDFDEVRIDMGAVERINSHAVMEWMKFIEKIQSRHALSYNLVSEVVLELTSLVCNFLGTAPIVIRKFIAPFYCAGCVTSHRLVIELQAISPQDSVHLVGTRPCPACGKNMHYDESPESLAVVLRAFSQNQTKPTTPRKTRPLK